MSGKPKWITEFPEGLTIRLTRYWDPRTSQWRQRMARLCECGHMYGGIQIELLPVPDTDEDPDDDWLASLGGA